MVKNTAGCSSRTWKQILGSSQLSLTPVPGLMSSSNIQTTGTHTHRRNKTHIFPVPTLDPQITGMQHNHHKLSRTPTSRATCKAALSLALLPKAVSELLEFSNTKQELPHISACFQHCLSGAGSASVHSTCSVLLAWTTTRHALTTQTCGPNCLP